MACKNCEQTIERYHSALKSAKEDGVFNAWLAFIGGVVVGFVLSSL